MYFHARQFPHFNGRSDEEIRAVARRAMQRHPRTIRLMNVRNAAVLLGMPAAAFLLRWLTSWNTGIVLMIVGGIATAAVLLWNLVWVNTVLFRLTQEEVAHGEE